MRINIRRNGRYLDISITDGGTAIDLGLLDECEARSFADTLQEAIDEVFESFPEKSDGESDGYQAP